MVSGGSNGRMIYAGGALTVKREGRAKSLGG